MCLDSGQGRTKLVGCIAGEALLSTHGTVYSDKQVVECLYDWLELRRRITDVHWLKVGRFAAIESPKQAFQWAQPLPHTQPQRQQAADKRERKRHNHHNNNAILQRGAFGHAVGRRDEYTFMVKRKKAPLRLADCARIKPGAGLLRQQVLGATCLQQHLPPG